MSNAFDPSGRLVLVDTILTGPAGTHQLRFAVDTGATRTAVAGHLLQLLGYAEPPAAERRRARTGSGETRAGIVSAIRIEALDQVRLAFPVLWLPLPPGVMVDGLLGLDFFRARVLTLDFIRGRITLRPRRPWWRFWG